MYVLETPRFPTNIAYGSQGGPEYRNIISEQDGGHETVEAKWAYPRHEYDVAYGIKSFELYEQMLDFFHAVEADRYAFRYKDVLDWKSCHTEATITALDVQIGVGNGSNKDFQLIKKYIKGALTKTRLISKPVTGTILAAVNGTPTTAFTTNTATGIVSFTVAPPDTQVVTAGFAFDVPVRFMDKKLKVSYESISLGQASIILREIRI